jgi:hypothetical protein
MSSRPTTLKEVAERSDTLENFGRNLRDWLHELRRASSRPQAELRVSEEPPRLSGKFKDGVVADAWLAAYAAHLAEKIECKVPHWTLSAERVLRKPTFDDAAQSLQLRELTVKRTPSAFRQRNIFTPSVDLPLRLRAGRPEKTVEEKRQTNAERQRRFRQRRAEELERLRQLSAV